MEMPLLYKFLSVILWPLQHIPHEQHCSIPDVLVIHKESSIGGFFFFSSLDLQLLDFLSWYFHHNHICAPPILPLQVLCCTTRTIICFLNFANLTLLFPHKFHSRGKTTVKRECQERNKQKLKQKQRLCSFTSSKNILKAIEED